MGAEAACGLRAHRRRGMMKLHPEPSKDRSACMCGRWRSGGGAGAEPDGSLYIKHIRRRIVRLF